MQDTTVGMAAPAPEHGAPPSQATLDANLAALERTSPRAARAIRMIAPSVDIEFIDTPEGAVGASIGGKALCSRRRPLEEAQRFADAVDLEKAGAVVVLGFGIGHHVEALALRARDVSAIIVFEPDLGLLRAAFERVDHSAWLSASKVVLVTEGENGATLSESLRGLEGALAVGVEFVEHPPSRSRLSDTAGRFSETFARVFQSVRTHIITSMVQTDTTVRNELMNCEQYVRRPGVEDLRGLASGHPAIVVSAGPSLKRNIELLKTPGLRDRCVIICVQTVLRQLLREGIRPHFVTAIDYHEISKRFYEGLEPADVTDVTLIAEARANPAILDAYPGPIRMPHDAFLTRTLGWEDRPDRGTMIPAATVAHLAYYVARHLGADPVILMGQDLAFTDGQYYAKHAAIHEVWAPELNAFNTLEMMEWQRIVRSRSTLYEVRDHLDRPVYTDEQMATYLAQFERDFQTDTEKGLTIIDATEGGVAKAHTSIMTLAQAIEGHATQLDTLPAMPTPVETATDEQTRTVRERLERVRLDVRDIARRSREARDLMRKMARSQKDIRKTNRLIDEVNAIRDRVQAHDPAFGLVMQLNQTGALKRFKADRAIKLAGDIDPFERQRLQIERDAMNLEWIGEYADLLDEYMRVAHRAFDGEPKLTRDILPKQEDDPSSSTVRVGETPRVAATLSIGRSDIDAAERDLLGRPVLAWTLSRLARCTNVDTVAITTSEPGRVGAIASTVNGLNVEIIEGASPDEARARSVASARAWADTSWRGGLAGLTSFDEGFDPVASATALERTGADAALLLGAAWAMVDPALTDEVIARHLECPEGNSLAFTQAPPGLAPAVIGRDLVMDLAQGQRDNLVFASIGGALGYIPTLPRHDPIARPSCVQIDPTLRATLGRFIVDDEQTCRGIESCFSGVREELGQMSGAQIASHWRDAMGSSRPNTPREITLELTTARPARGDRFWYVASDPTRPPMNADAAAGLIERIAQSCPNVRLTLAGYGDPLEHDACLDVIDQAHRAGIPHIHVRTDLLCDPAMRERLAGAPIDVLSVDALAHRAETYRRITGIDMYSRVCEGFDDLLRRRESAGGMPHQWLVPRITRRDDVYEEIEIFFDKWILLTGAAVIDQLPESRPGDRIEPLGKPRMVLERDARRRMTILCDGSVVCDELGFAGSRPVANVFETSLEQAWAQVIDQRSKRLDAATIDHTDIRTGW